MKNDVNAVHVRVHVRAHVRVRVHVYVHMDGQLIGWICGHVYTRKLVFGLFLFFSEKR